MTDLLLLLIGAILVNNLVLALYFGVDPFMYASGEPATASTMAAVITVVMTFSSLFTWLIHHFVLLPFDLAYLRTLTYLMVVVAVSTITSLALLKLAPAQRVQLRGLLPMLAINCAVLGVALINDDKSNTFIESVGYGFGSGLGLALVLILFAALRERLAVADVPQPFQGAAIALVTAGLMSLAFMGFAGPG